jgi:hypothetical protein
VSCTDVSSPNIVLVELVVNVRWRNVTLHIAIWLLNRTDEQFKRTAALCMR